jgi:hypothetical protein
MYIAAAALRTCTARGSLAHAQQQLKNLVSKCYEGMMVSLSVHQGCDQHILVYNSTLIVYIHC